MVLLRYQGYFQIGSNSKINRGVCSLLNEVHEHCDHMMPIICSCTYNSLTRNRLNVWSYADDLAPPGKTSAHSDPAAIFSGWKYWASKICWVEMATNTTNNLKIILRNRNLRINLGFSLFQTISAKLVSNSMFVVIQNPLIRKTKGI